MVKIMSCLRGRKPARARFGQEGQKSMDLNELRGRIDSIDEQIIRLYEERMDVCRQVAEYKIENGKKVYDRVREEEKLAKARSMAHSDFTALHFKK